MNTSLLRSLSLLSFGLAALPASVQSPGFETGDFTGWPPISSEAGIRTT